MFLHELLHGIEYTGYPPAGEASPPDRDITLVTEDSRKVIPGCVFVCVRGNHFDGHQFAAQAIENGAACVVAERDTGVSPQILVEDARKAYGLLCGNFHGEPAKKLTLVGVTGTNGKSTIACLLKEIFDAAGYTSGLISTVKILVDQEELPTDSDIPTTPDTCTLHTLFAKMVDGEQSIVGRYGVIIRISLSRFTIITLDTVTHIVFFLIHLFSIYLISPLDLLLLLSLRRFTDYEDDEENHMQKKKQ